MSAYHSFNMKKGIVDFTSGVDCHGTDVAVPAGLTELIIPASKALVVEHVGKYSHLGNAWSTGHQHIRYKKLKPAKIPSCEIYRNNPHETAEEDLITEVNLPLR